MEYYEETTAIGIAVLLISLVYAIKRNKTMKANHEESSNNQNELKAGQKAQNNEIECLKQMYLDKLNNDESLTSADIENIYAQNAAEKAELSAQHEAEKAQLLTNLSRAEYYQREEEHKNTSLEGRIKLLQTSLLIEQNRPRDAISSADMLKLNLKLNSIERKLNTVQTQTQPPDPWGWLKKRKKLEAIQAANEGSASKHNSTS